ncbi:hypothetical protein SUGI_0099190 [Cryptomeria japonica]|nr:hypothetical protein SUGI_0099190 [Cryptomeria japonica]
MKPSKSACKWQRRLNSSMAAGKIQIMAIEVFPGNGTVWADSPAQMNIRWPLYYAQEYQECDGVLLW